MITERSFPRTFDELREVVASAVGGATPLAAQAGHFLLYFDTVEDRVLPGIASELKSPRHELLRKEVGGFPALSWQLALDLLGPLPAREKHLMVVVNDWQYLPEGVNRARFYSQQRDLPEEFSEAFARSGGGIQLLTPKKSSVTYPFFGEKNLRNRYRRAVENLLRKGLLPSDTVTTTTSEGVACNLPDILGRKLEIYCSTKTGDCSAEIAMMLDFARSETGCDAFLNFYPAVCREFVELGTELGARLFGTDIRTVVNIGLRTSGVSTINDLLADAEVAVHNFKPIDEIRLRSEPTQ